MHTAVFQTKIDASIEEVWEFFSSPKNLAKLTPNHMNFKILAPLNIGEMRKGLVITYTVCPFPKIPVGWMTEISAVNKHHYFVDRQLHGPFKVWHHQHIFKEVKPGVIEMTDVVNYVVPFGVLGRLFNYLIIRNKVNNIFAYRNEVIRHIFP